MFIYRPGESRFREKWLKDIIENKVMMMQAIEFQKEKHKNCSLEEKSCDILLSDVIFACWSQLSNYDLIIMCINLLQVFELKVNICI